MVCLAFFVLSVLADDYWKTICVCPSDLCVSSNYRCKGQPTIDPTSSNFMQDFNYARKNIKNVNLYFNTVRSFALDLDMRNIAGLTLNFSSYFTDIDVRLTYVNDGDYRGNFLNFIDPYVRPVFIPIADSKPENILRIGSLNCKRREGLFYLNGNMKTSLYYDSLMVSTASLTNISALNKMNVGASYFVIGRDDRLSIQFSKEAAVLKVNNSEFNFVYKHEDSFEIEGQYRNIFIYNDTLIIKIDEDVAYSDLPVFSFSSISNLEFLGKFSSPSPSNPIRSITRVANLTIPSGDFPFSIFSDYIKLHISGDTTIYGDIDASNSSFSSAAMEITTNLVRKVNVSFKGYVDSQIYIQSPYLNLNIDNYTNNNTNSWYSTFPISFSFNENSASYVYVKSISFRTSSKTYASTFECFPTITKVYSDEELDSNKILRGFIFIDLPENTIDSTSFNLKVNKNSPSVLNNIPGFINNGICMSVKQDGSGRMKLMAYKSKTAFSLPAYICITTRYGKCSTPYGFLTNPFTDVTSLIDGDISPYVGKGFKEIFISTTIYGREIKINFNKLSEKSYNVTLNGFSSSQYYISVFSLVDDSNKVKNISIKNSKLSKGFSFMMPSVSLVQVSFETAQLFKFDKSTKLITDALSLESLFKLSVPPTLNDVYLQPDYSQLSSYYDFEETIVINNDRYSICLRGNNDYNYYSSSLKENKNASLHGIISGYGYKDVCADGIDSRYLNKFTYLSRNPLIFSINSMTPSVIKPINIVVNPKYTYYGTSYFMKLGGKGWESKLTNKFTVDNGNNFITIKVSSPGQADNIKITGKASALFQVNYPYTQSYCIYVPGSRNSCYSSYSYSIKQIKATDFNSSVANISGTSISLRFDNKADPYVIPISLFNMRKVTLSTSSFNQNASEVEFNFDSTSIDPIYSLAVFNTIKTVYTKDTEVTAYFGQLRISGIWTVDEKWKKNVNLIASQLICKYNDLYKFKHVMITDQLNVTGDVPTEGDDVTVDFRQDNDANDLVANIKGNVTITIGKGFVKIGRCTFKISHSSNYDAYFRVTGHSNIVIDSSISSKTDFVKFVLDCRSYTVNIQFIGKYPVLTGSEQSLIMLKGTRRVNILTDSSLPLSVYNFLDIEFHFLTSDVSVITGPIQYTSSNVRSTNGRIRFYNDQSKRVSLKIPHGFIINTMESSGSNFTSIMSPNIDIEVGKVTKENENTNGIIYITNSIGNIGASKISFVEPLPEGIMFGNITYVVTQVYGKITDESSFPFVNAPETIIKAKTNDISLIDFTFNYIVINREGITHGFYPGVNCLSINQTRVRDYYSEVSLSAFVKPSEIPFIIDFVDKGMKTNGELVIDEDNIRDLENLNNLLPNIFVGVVMRLYKDMSPNFILNLNNIVNGRKSLSVEIQSVGRTQFEAYISLPSSNIVTLTCINVKIGFNPSGSDKFLAKKANFTDCIFLNANQFKFSNDIEEIVMDVDSLNGLVSDENFESFTGKVTVNSANVIVFTKDGWEFREDRARSTIPIKADMFKNIQFQTGLFCLLMIEDENLDSIHSFKFDTFPDDQGTVLFELSRHWGKIKNLNGFKINVNGATRVNLNTASYPIPKLFDIDESNIGYTLETDISGNFDTITLENNRLFKDEDLNMNFQFLPPEYQYVNGDKVIFEGNSNFNLVNNVGTLRVNESVFSSHSNTTLSKLETLKLMTVERTAEVTGTFKFSLSSTLQLHWTLTETPMINHKSFEKGSPQWLELIYDDSTVDKNLYREKLLRKNSIVLMKGNFECYSVKNNIKFGGSYAPFGAGNTHLSLGCDSSAEGQVLLLQGLTDISDDEDDASQGGGKGNKVQTGGIVGIIIACTIVVGVATAGVVYFIQRKKIDRLKNEIPTENNQVYRSSAYETRETTQSATEFNSHGDGDPFDDI